MDQKEFLEKFEQADSVLDKSHVAESIHRNIEENLKIIRNDLAEAARTKIPRFEDGTYHRPRDMWADDLFMSCPLLVRAGRIFRDESYFAEVIRQFRGFRERLWMAGEKIMSHIFLKQVSAEEFLS